MHEIAEAAMEDLINGDTIGWFILLLAFTLSMTASAKARLDARVSKRCIGLQQREHPAHPRIHCPRRTCGPCRLHDPGAEAAVSELPREGCRRAHRASAHGKECTPC